MRIDSNIPPSIPFHVSRAYGAQPAGNAGKVEGVSNRVLVTEVTPVSRIRPNTAQANLEKSAARRLVSAVVPGRVDFTSGGEAQPSAGSFAMYRHPADKNSAATAVNVGRALDVQG